MTVNRVMTELTIVGRLRRVQGLGTFVADKAPLAPIFEIRSIAQEIRMRGASHSCKVITNETLPAGAAEAERLSVALGTPVFRLLALHSSDGVPIQVERRLVNPIVCPEFGSQDFTHKTALDYILEKIIFTDVEHEVDAVAPLPESCEMLDIAPIVPCLRLMHRAWMGARIATYAQLTHPSAAYRLGGRTGAGLASSENAS